MHRSTATTLADTAPLDVLRRRDEEIAPLGVLDAAPKELQAVVDMAASIAGVPLASVNVVTSEAQHQVATVGFDGPPVERASSLCARTVDDGRPVVVADARLDERFRDNPWVDGRAGAVRFYAAHPLVTSDDVVIGTLCVFDVEPREVDRRQRLGLQALADRVVDVIEMSRQAQALDAALLRVTEVSAELQRSNEHLAAFAGQVSHDLRNPLTTTSMALHLLRDVLTEHDELGDLGNGSDLGDDAPAPRTSLADGVDVLDHALRSVARMETLVEDLLSYARVGGEHGRVAVDLRQVVRDVLSDLADALVGADVTVDALPTVVGDPTQLRAVLQNLIANAAKFVAPGTRPRIEVSARRTRSGAPGWVVEVADRGIGIDPTETEHVFEPLVRVGEAEGSGIGLATCRRVVASHGGRISLLPRAGGGTVAWFSLPD
ncbi:ATP-binding protein [Nocardioides zeae]|uniref:Sensor-like histidine kinase SenX3 n=1 Tax=Nocardioides imazamoxiresistens TaxID=3231893 RepID=A0ABU3PS92_9ACTN|nr:ATP-binding protein [Nocardioides zeae]MDT9592097.1 ATP-binding protein [Nocardioides zeae]